ncbi:MAG: transposase [Candidatus Omnitrophica bacterium]|nr:transposase [Candidatus Omnitrophota bacterium]
MGKRKIPLVANCLYHIYSRAVPGTDAFKDPQDYNRFIKSLYFYCIEDRLPSFSFFLERKKEIPLFFNKSQKHVSIHTYCLMPNHLHMILSSKETNGISMFLQKTLKSHSLYYNSRYKRKGHLWQGKFENIIIQTDEQLLHTIRYIHLNPVTAYLVDYPQQWKYSSYKEYIERPKLSLCNIPDTFYRNIDHLEFTKEAIEIQREKAKNKKLKP